MMETFKKGEYALLETDGVKKIVKIGRNPKIEIFGKPAYIGDCGTIINGLHLTKINIIHLTLNKKWFDMIASGDKKIEYREIKPYWNKRLEKYDCNKEGNICYYRPTYVIFKNGYQKDAPTMAFDVVSVSKRGGRQEWGTDPFKDYWTIQLDKQIKI